MLAALGATLTTWLASQGASLVLGALAKLALDAWYSWQANKAQRDVAAATVKLDQANATIEAQQDELQALADAPQTVSDAIKRLREGSA